MSRWERPVLVRTDIVLDNQCRSHLQSQMTPSLRPTDCQNVSHYQQQPFSGLHRRTWKIRFHQGMSLMGSNLLQWLLYGKQFSRPNGALRLAIAWSGFYSRGCYKKSTRFYFNIFFYCSHTTDKFKLQNKKEDKFKLIWTIILTGEPNITKMLLHQRDKCPRKYKLK